MVVDEKNKMMGETKLQGSLLISKLDFFIKADFRGLVFFISRPYEVFL